MQVAQLEMQFDVKLQLRYVLVLHAFEVTDNNYAQFFLNNTINGCRL